MAAGDPKIQIDITATDKASDKIDDVADAAADLEKLSPELEVTADTGGAVGDIKAVGDAADTLSRADTELVIRAKIDQAKGELKALQAELGDTADKADDTAKHLDKIDSGGGTGLRGNAISDLTGPLGDASSAASDFGGVFDGLGDTIEGVASKMGASSEAAARMGQAVAGFGFVVAAGAAAWTLFRQRQEAAKKAAEEAAKAQRDLNDAIKDGDKAAATANFEKIYGDAFKAAHTLGLTTQEVTEHIIGQRDALQDVQQWIGNAYAGDTLNKVINAKNVIEDMRTKWLENNAAVEAADKTNDEVATGLGITEKAVKDTGTAAVKMGDQLEAAADQAADGLDRIRGRLDMKRAVEDFQATMIEAQNAIHDKSADTVVDLRGVEDAIVAAGEAAHLNPIDVETAIQKADQGDIDGAYLFMQQKINERGPLEVKVALHATVGKLTLGGRGGTTIVVETDAQTRGSAAPTGNTYNVTMPRGIRTGDLSRALGTTVRRNGRRYGVVTR